MRIRKIYKDQITQQLQLCVEKTISRLDRQDTYRPFHSAILPKEALFWSRFERSFSSSFGQSAVERISEIAAIVGGAEKTERGKETFIELSNHQLIAVDGHIDSLRSGRTTPNWHTDLIDVLSASQAGNKTTARVISDLWWINGKVENFLSIKTVKPNLDQTAQAKRDLLKLKLGYRESNVFFGLYYNPFGDQKTEYRWKPPKRIFNFALDPCVLIGKEYWDKLGGSGFYEELLAIVKIVGKSASPRIKSLM